MKLDWKLLLFGAGLVLAAVFVYESLAGQLGKSTSVFNPDNYAA